MSEMSIKPGKQKTGYRRVFITECSESDYHFLSLFYIFRQTLKPGMQFREFRAYFYSARLQYIDATFILCGREVIGFCSAAFYTTVINDGTYTVGRAATGILAAYRGHTLPKWKLYKKYILYWCRNPFRRIVLTAYVANPLIYAMICKYTGIAYPRPDTRPPGGIVRLKNELLRSQNLSAKEDPDFVVDIHFCVAINEGEMERIFDSGDAGVKYFLQINPRFRQQRGVVVIIPVNALNILSSAFRFFYYMILKRIKFA